MLKEGRNGGGGVTQNNQSSTNQKVFQMRVVDSILNEGKGEQQKARGPHY